MQILNPYKEWERPEYFQGPAFSFYREEKKQNNRKHFYNDIELQGKFIQHSDYELRKLQERNALKEQDFDFRKEKTTGNKFWKDDKMELSRTSEQGF